MSLVAPQTFSISLYITCFLEANLAWQPDCIPSQSISITGSDGFLLISQSAPCRMARLVDESIRLRRTGRRLPRIPAIRRMFHLCSDTEVGKPDGFYSIFPHETHNILQNHLPARACPSIILRS